MVKVEIKKADYLSHRYAEKFKFKTGMYQMQNIEN